MTDYTCRAWEENDLPHLLSYLTHLDHETRLRFEPHPFTMHALYRLYHDPSFMGFILIENRSTYIIGYTIIKLGYFEHDVQRLNSFSFFPEHHNTAMYAPSLAAGWRNKGLGKILWQNTETYLKQLHVKQVLLWGGVQETNKTAVTHYQKLGFETIGGFAMNGMWNVDMVKYV